MLEAALKQNLLPDAALRAGIRHLLKQRLRAQGEGGLEARERLIQWRVFFMACAELFGSGAGERWFVSHYLFERNPG